MSTFTEDIDFTKIDKLTIKQLEKINKKLARKWSKLHSKFTKWESKYLQVRAEDHTVPKSKKYKKVEYAYWKVDCKFNQIKNEQGFYSAILQDRYIEKEYKEDE